MTIHLGLKTKRLGNHMTGPRSNGNECVLCIPQNSSITGFSPSDCLMSYLGHSLVGVLPLYRDTVSVFCNPRWLGWTVGMNTEVLNDSFKEFSLRFFPAIYFQFFWLKSFIFVDWVWELFCWFLKKIHY